MKPYDHKEIEQAWQERWERDGLYRTEEDSGKPKCYALDMFPYPSGAGLHIGHPKGYVATDVYSRYKKMNGFNILHPMGWDAFGLPAENYAIKNKVHPGESVAKNIIRFKEQLRAIGFNYDWEREVNTTDPDFYRWTQWAFIQMFKKGLAYESYEPINWCPGCKTGLANEDLEGDRCERCDSIVEKRPMRQWVLRITAYADRLLADLDKLPWPESVKEMQRNWIGRSEGALLKFKTQNAKRKTTTQSSKVEYIEVFTTRPDTLFGATYVVVAPEHTLVQTLIDADALENADEVRAYLEETKRKTDIDRTAANKEKTGVLLEGVTAVNPANGAEVPVYAADYVLATYGTGAIMAVPAHDERDHAFAVKYGIPIVEVIAGGNVNEAAYTGPGPLVHSGAFDGMSSDEAKHAITKHAAGTLAVRYRLQDWVFSRQRYWGEPIPLIHCEACGVVPVPEEQLPVRLPNVTSYEPTGTGESPLANIPEWVNTPCPVCGKPAKRETNTMPQWAGSSWYYLRYIDPANKDALVDKAKEAYWSPVDVYVGGLEHATRHLIYARFWHKFLYDIGTVSGLEPFSRLYTVGLILAEDGRKMSKRWGNVINPDEMVERVGADALRVYQMFMGPFGQAVAWSTDHMVGARRFLERVWALCEKRTVLADNGTDETNRDVLLLAHKTIRKVGEDIESFNFNTAVSQLMVYLNALEKQPAVSAETYDTLLRLLAPFAPHMTEELWHQTGHEGSIHRAPWPSYDAALLATAEVTITVQVNGKVRATFTAEPGLPKDALLARAKALPAIAARTSAAAITREIVVPDRLVNLVLAPSAASA